MLELSVQIWKSYVAMRKSIDGLCSKSKKNKVIRPNSRASALSEKSGRQTDEQTKTFKKTFELATKSS